MWALLSLGALRHQSSHPAISIQPSRNIHAEHPQDESSREHVQVVQSRVTYQPEYSVEDSENDNDGNSIARERTSIASEVHGPPAFRFPPSVGILRLGSRAY